MIDEIASIIKLFAYIWAVVETGSLASLYFYAFKNNEESKVMKYLFMFLSAVSLNLFYRFIFSYTSRIAPDYHDFLRNAVIFPLLLVVFTARAFKRASLEIDKVKEHLLDSSKTPEGD